MIGTLKKLEASETGASSVGVFEGPRTGVVDQMGDAPQDRRLLSVPTNGWLSGPGRAANRR